jgi:hypothetical protein
MMGGLNRPNPRKLSELFMKGPDGLGSVMNRTALFAFFGTICCYLFFQTKNITFDNVFRVGILFIKTENHFSK